MSSVAFSGTAAAHRGGLKGELAEVRSATANYNDPANAYDDGYFAPDRNFDPIPLEEVVERAHSVCGMGYHFVNPDLFGTDDRTEPQVLVYGEGDDGDLMLGAVEYLLPQADEEEEREEPDLFAHDDGDEQWESFHGSWSSLASEETPPFAAGRNRVNHVGKPPTNARQLPDWNGTTINVGSHI